MNLKALTPEEKKEFKLLNKHPWELSREAQDRLRELRGKIMASTPRKASTGIPKRSKLRPVSKKQAKINTEYTKLRKVFMEENPICMWPGCNAPSVECHHSEGRGAKTTLKIESFRALCSEHHHQGVHAHPNEARKLGLLK